MLPRKTIHIVVMEDGSVKTDFINFTGTDCIAAGQQMHSLLAQFGVQVDQTTFIPKPELFVAQGVQKEVMVEANQEMQTEG